MGGPGSGRRPSGKKMTVSINGRKKTFTPKTARRALLKHRGHIFARATGANLLKKIVGLRRNYLGKGLNKGKGNT